MRINNINNKNLIVNSTVSYEIQHMGIIKPSMVGNDVWIFSLGDDDNPVDMKTLNAFTLNVTVLLQSLKMPMKNKIVITAHTNIATKYPNASDRQIIHSTVDEFIKEYNQLDKDLRENSFFFFSSLNQNETTTREIFNQLNQGCPNLEGLITTPRLAIYTDTP